MSFISPMLAGPMPKAFVIRPGEWVAEEKLDGHRLVLQVYDEQPKVVAWSRNGLERVLPQHVVAAASKLPVGIYDGELLVPGKRSYGVTELTNGPNLAYVVFDILELLGVSTVAQTWTERRAYLDEMAARGLLSGAVRISSVYQAESMDDVNLLAEDIWSHDGEGLILKRKASRYSVGKRPKGDWIKIKALHTAVLTIIGFKPSRGEIVNRGPYATVVLRDDEGFETTVKTLNDVELARFEAEAKESGDLHPASGRRLRIEFQERTPDGSYRHPRWDRWCEDEE